MRNLGVAIDIEAAEPRNRRSTCENYLRAHEHTSTRSWNIVFSLGHPLFSISVTLSSFSFISPSSSFSFSLSLSLFFALPLTLATNHSIGHPISMLDTRIVHSLRIVSSAIRKRTEIRRRRRGHVGEYRSRSPYLETKNHVALRVYIDATRADIWADLTKDQG